METNTQIAETAQKPELYLPKNCLTLADNVVEPQIRLGLQSAPGEGKTWAACSFPNVVALNLNRGLGAQLGRSDIIDVPIYSPAFVDMLVKRKPNSPPNKRDAVVKWLNEEAYKLTVNQTLLVDALSDLERAFDIQEDLEPVLTTSGAIDTFARWKHKLDYFAGITDVLMSIKCNVVVCSHEQQDRNSKGDLNGKLKPLLTGQAGDKIQKDFTDWFRQRASDKPKGWDVPGYKPDDKILKSFNMTHAEFMSFLKSFPRDTMYYWQTESDDVFSGKCSSLVNFPRFIPANYESFKKYRRKITI